ncbi:MAG: adenylate kinase [Akkermansiaceae bacterium]|nr:adenylate kinase [Akkermansiaceae bacterium]
MSLRLVLLGPPASGKGTQGRRLAEELGLSYLSTGALLRSAVEAGSALGKEAEPILARGEYLPDSLMSPIMAEWLSTQTGTKGWVLDGFPRSLAQAEFLDQALEKSGHALDAAILLEVPERDLLRRIRGRLECPECRWTGQLADLNGADRCPECGGVPAPRIDDTEVNFRSRFSEYVTHTAPVAEVYEGRGLLHRCDATATMDQVAARLLNLARTLSSHGQAA